VHIGAKVRQSASSIRQYIVTLNTVALWPCDGERSRQTGLFPSMAMAWCFRRRFHNARQRIPTHLRGRNHSGRPVARLGDDKAWGAAIAAVLSLLAKTRPVSISVVEDSLIARKPSEIVYETLDAHKGSNHWGRPRPRTFGETHATESYRDWLPFGKHGTFAPENNADYDLREKSGMIQIPRSAHRGMPPVIINARED